MNTRTKSVVVIISTLVIGIAIGALGAAAIINSRLEQFRALRMRGGMMGMVEQVIEPHDDAQRARVRGILERYNGMLESLRQGTMERHERLLDSMRLELNDILTPDQRERFDDWLSHDRGPGGPPGGPGGPPGGGPPGFGPPPGGPPPFGPPPGGGPPGAWRHPSQADTANGRGGMSDSAKGR
jgi:hypothetical protein